MNLAEDNNSYNIKRIYIKNNDVVSLHYYLQSDESIDFKSDGPILHLAKTEQMFWLLIEHDADVEAKDSYGNTPLVYFTICNRIDLVKSALKANANVNAVNSLGFTAYEIAYIKKYQDMINLFPKKININLYDKDINNMLITAIEYDDISYVKHLLIIGADINVVKDRYRLNSFDSLKKKISYNMIQLLNFFENYLTIPKDIFDIVKQNRIDLVKDLRSKQVNDLQNPDINIIDKFGFTLLNYAIKNQYKDMEDLLINKGIDTIFQDGKYIKLYGNLFIEVLE